MNKLINTFKVTCIMNTWSAYSSTCDFSTFFHGNLSPAYDYFIGLIRQILNV